jgi:hypothetical protein
VEHPDYCVLHLKKIDFKIDSSFYFELPFAIARIYFAVDCDYQTQVENYETA